MVVKSSLQRQAQVSEGTVIPQTDIICGYLRISLSVTEFVINACCLKCIFHRVSIGKFKESIHARF